MRQFLKGRDISRFNQSGKKHQFSKRKLKPGQPISVRVDFAKII